MATFNDTYCPICDLDFNSIEELRNHVHQNHHYQMELYRRERNRENIWKWMPDGMKIEYESKWEEYVSTGRNKFNCSNCKEEIELPTFSFNHQYRCKCDNHKYCSRHCQKIHWKKIHRYECEKSKNLKTFNYDEISGDWECVEFLKIIMIIKEFAG